MHLQFYLHQYFEKVYIAINNRTTELLQQVLEARFGRDSSWLFFYRLRGK